MSNALTIETTRVKTGGNVYTTTSQSKQYDPGLVQAFGRSNNSIDQLPASTLRAMKHAASEAQFGPNGQVLGLEQLNQASTASTVKGGFFSSTTQTEAKPATTRDQTTRNIFGSRNH
jgi:hypothetical protein